MPGLASRVDAGGSGSGYLVWWYRLCGTGVPVPGHGCTTTGPRLYHYWARLYPIEAQAVPIEAQAVPIEARIDPIEARIDPIEARMSLIEAK